MKKFLWILVLSLIILISGCGSSEDADPLDYYGDDYSNEDTDPEPPAPDDGDVVLEGGEVIQSGDLPALLNRKIIYTASLGISTESPEEVYQEVLASVGTYQAYIESESITSNKYVVKIRVLSEQFTDFVEEIKQSGDLINYEKTSQDVTNQYSTFEARRLALETQQERIIELIASAEDLSDLLTLEEARVEIEAELNEIGEALASYDSLIDYSTVNLTINRATEQEIILPQTERPAVQVLSITKTTAELEVTNRNDAPAIIYVDLLENGEFLRQYEGQAFPDGSAIFEIDALESNTEYSFKITTISADYRESSPVTKTLTTESTFFNKVGNIFRASFALLVMIFEFFGLAFVAILPFALVIGLIAVPSRILYVKYGKERLKERKAAKMQRRVKEQEELRDLRLRQQKELRKQREEANKTE
jgi:hypothetical protein